jgi:hypothetical protein
VRPVRILQVSQRFETATAPSSSIAVGADNETPRPVRLANSTPAAAISTVHRTVTSHLSPTMSGGRTESGNTKKG